MQTRSPHQLARTSSTGRTSHYPQAGRSDKCRSTRWESHHTPICAAIPKDRVSSGKIAPSSAPAIPRGHREAQHQSLRRGFSEAHLSTKSAEAGENPRFSCSHEDTCRPLDPEVPPRQGPSPADGLVDGAWSGSNPTAFREFRHTYRAWSEWTASNFIRCQHRSRFIRRCGVRDQP